MPHKEKHTGFLKFIIVYKTFMGIIQLTLTVFVLRLVGEDLSEVGTHLAELLHLNVTNTYINKAIMGLGLIEPSTVFFLGVIIFITAVFNLTEAYGLHIRRRWAEWLTVASTATYIPFEIYILINKFSAIKSIVLILNILIVYYLTKHTELFKNKKESEGSLAEDS